MRRSLTKIAVGLGAMSLVLTACVSSDGDTAAETTAAETATETTTETSEEVVVEGEPLVLGIVQAASGFMGPIDTPARNALLMEVDKVNAAGGVNGQPIVVE